MEWNLNTVIALGALLVGVAAILIKALDKSLTLREHDEFRSGVEKRFDVFSRRQDERLEIREFKDWRDQITRDFDRIEADLRVIESTRPTSGELEAAIEAIKARLDTIEEFMKHLASNNKT